MDRKIEIKNKAWYDRKSEQLNQITAGLQRANPRPFVFTTLSKNRYKIFKIMDAYGILFTSEAQLILCHTINYAPKDNIQEELDKLTKSDSFMADWMDTKLNLHNIKMPLYEMKNFKDGK